MKEPLKDAFFQPANHPYFVKEKPFWTIDRAAAAAGAQKSPARADSNALASDSSCNIFRCESSRAGSVTLSLPSAPSSSLQLSTIHDCLSAASTVADTCPADERGSGVTAAAAALQGSRRTPCAPHASGDAGCFLVEQHRGSGGAGVVINAATCPNLCRHASFLTDSLNRKNLLGGYFDADYEENSSAPEVPSGSSRRRRLRRRSDSLRCDSTGSSAGRYGDSRAGFDEQPEGSSESDGQPSPAAATAALESAPASASSGGRATATAVTAVGDAADVCSVCSNSSDGSGNAADVIQPVALKLHLADEVREDVTKMASSLTRRLFFARPKQHEDIPTVPAVTLYHRDSDRSHLNVQTPGRVSSEVQRSASVPRCEAAAPRSRERMRPSDHAASMTNHRSRPLESLPSYSSILSQSAGTGRPSDRDLPWVTSASRSNLVGGGLSAGAQFSSGSGSSVFMAALEQLSVDDPSVQSERHERKRRRCRRRCCRAAIACAVLALVGAVVAVVTTLHAFGLLSSDAVGYDSTRAPTTSAVTTIPPATSTPSAKSVTITFVGALRLMMDFLPEMTDLNSTASRNLSKLFCSAVDRIYYNSSDSLMYDPLNGCQVTNLTRGSIKMNFRVMFAAVLPESKDNSSSGDLAKCIVNKLRAYIKGYNSDGLTWDTDFFEMYEERDLPAATPGEVSNGDTTNSSSQRASTKANASYQPDSTDQLSTGREPTVDSHDVYGSSTSLVSPVLTSANSNGWTATALTQEVISDTEPVIIANTTAPAFGWLLTSAKPSPTEETAWSAVQDDAASRMPASSSSVWASSSAVTGHLSVAEVATSAAIAATTSASNSRVTTRVTTGSSTTAARQSPCHSLGNLTGFRAVADPLNCRAFYVCYNSTSVVAHWNCSSNASYYSYYNAERKVCEYCDVTKCNQCAGLRPWTKIVLPVFARTPSTVTTASSPTTSHAATGTASSTLGVELLPAGTADKAVAQLSAGAAAAVPLAATPGEGTEWAAPNRPLFAATAAAPNNSVQQRGDPLLAASAADVGFTPAASKSVDNEDFVNCTSATAAAAGVPCLGMAAVLPSSPAPIEATKSAVLLASASDRAVLLLPSRLLPPSGSELDIAAAALTTSTAEQAYRVEPAPSRGSATLISLSQTIRVPSTSAEPAADGSACAPTSDTVAAAVPCSPAITPVDLAATDPARQWMGAAILSKPPEATQPLTTSNPSASASRLVTSAVPSSVRGLTIGARLWPGPVQSLCAAVDMNSSPKGVVVADPDDCTRFAYCFKSRTAVLWQCECGHMYVAGLQACSTCVQSECGSCKPCED